MIYFPFVWCYDWILHPAYVFCGVLYYFIRYFFTGGGDPGDFANSMRERFGVEIFHAREDIPDNNVHPTDNPDIQEIRVNDNRAASTSSSIKLKTSGTPTAEALKSALKTGKGNEQVTFADSSGNLKIWEKGKGILNENTKKPTKISPSLPHQQYHQV